MARKLTIEQVFEAIKKERQNQDAKYGSIDNRERDITGYMIVADLEIEEAKKGWAKNVPGKHSCLAEMVQIASVFIACLEEHGLEGN